MQLSKSVILMVMAVLTIVSGTVLAADIKVAVISYQKLLKYSKIGKSSQAKLEKEFKGRRAKLISKSTKFNEMVSKIRTKNTPEYIAQVEKFRNEIKEEQANLAADYKKRRIQELKKINDKVKVAIKKLGKNDKYDLILTSGVIYSTKSVDITAKIQAMIDK